VQAWVTVTEFEASNREYLRMATTLLQRARLADDESGLWEAADIQWSWRRDQHDDPGNAHFWIDRDGIPDGVVSFTDSGDTWGCDVVALPNAEQLPPGALWRHALERMARLPARPIEVAVRDDDVLTASLLAEAGFARGDDSVMTCWMPVGNRPSIRPIAGGYRLFSTANRPVHPHHMVGRNGAHVAERLRECSLYDPELDLYIVTSNDEIAAYGMFWADPVTGVGLVEPMRTEDRHQHKGLARHLLDTGLDLLARHRCTRLKVSYYEANEPARLLYVGAGFDPRTRSGTYRRPAAASDTASG
jgi:GNAT superfamily N-acetyltransferase